LSTRRTDAGTDTGLRLIFVSMLPSVEHPRASSSRATASRLIFVSMLPSVEHTVTERIALLVRDLIFVSMLPSVEHPSRPSPGSRNVTPDLRLDASER
jgi:hypothetical protein